MAGKVVKKETFRKNVIRDMKQLRTYSAEYNPVIDVYCEMYEQYQRLTERYRAGGLEGVSIAKRLEARRKDFAAYSDRLGLNPKAMKDLRPDRQSKKAGLVHRLRMIEADTG